MKKILTTITILTISILSITFLIYPKQTFSEIENRNLSEMPKLTLNNVIDGSYMQDLETYINDNFPIRNIFINIRTITYKLTGRNNINNVYIGKDNYLLENYKDIDYKEDIINTINKLYNNNKYTNINIMLVPTKIIVYKDKLPHNAITYNQLDTINKIYNNLDQNINKIDLYNTLYENKNKYNLYYKTDHHWTTYGAYLSYKEFCIKNNINYIDISNFNIKTVTNTFKGSTYSKIVDPSSISEAIDIFNYKNYTLEVNYVMSKKITNTLYNYEYLNKKDKYAMFLDNNHSLITIENKDLTNKENILIIKDSYANSMIPFLTNHYNKIHIIDPRYYKKSITKYIEENKIENVLILYNIGTLSVDKNILSIR